MSVRENIEQKIREVELGITFHESEISRHCKIRDQLRDEQDQLYHDLNFLLNDQSEYELNHLPLDESD